MRMLNTQTDICIHAGPPDSPLRGPVHGVGERGRHGIQRLRGAYAHDRSRSTVSIACDPCSFALNFWSESMMMNWTASPATGMK